MEPQSPVILGRPELKDFEVIYDKDQPEYKPLPALRADNGIAVSRWKLSFKERLQVLLTGNLYLSQLTFNQPLQPQNPTVDVPEFCLSEATQ